MGGVAEIWRLYHEGAVAAELHVVEADFPWLVARVVKGAERRQAAFRRGAAADRRAYQRGDR